MADSMLPFGELDFSRVQDRHDSWKVLQEDEGPKDYGINYKMCSGFDNFEDNVWEDGNIFLGRQQEEQQELSASSYPFLDGLLFDFESSATQTSSRGTANQVAALKKGNQDFELRKEKSNSSPMVSLELLKCFGNGHKRLDTRKMVAPCGEIASTMAVEKKLSTQQVVRLAGEKFIQTSSAVDDLDSLLGHPYGMSFSCQSEEEKREVQLVELLYSSAEKVSEQQFDRARTLLNQCIRMSSREGNTIQRLVYYFAGALLEKIARGGTGVHLPEDTGKRETFNLELDLSVMNLSSIRVACHQAMPFCQVAQFTGAQAVMESVANARKVHVIDFLIGSGLQWTILMQSLAARQDIEHLKISAVGTSSKDMIEETGYRLTDFAQNLKVPFSFKLVMVPDMLDLKTDSFERDPEEVVIVYSQYFLRTMIGRQHPLEHVMAIIRSLDPSLMVVTEVEANHNSPRFVHRFIDCLFFFSAFFDCLEDCMKQDDQNRLIVESLYFGQGIRNMVVSEGAERTTRSVKIDVWRAFFARYGMVETELSSSSWYQADLLVKKFTCGNFCTLDMNGKSLFVGWKGTPINSLSVWKFT